MTKYVTIILLIIILAITFACGPSHRQAEYNEKIAQAENILDSMPDSVLSLLAPIALDSISDPHESAKAYYLRGAAKLALWDFTGAMSDLLQAEKKAEDLNDYELNAISACAIMELYDSIQNTQQRIQYAYKTAKAYNKAGKPEKSLQLLHDIILRAYFSNQPVDIHEAYSVMDEIARSSNDSCMMDELSTWKKYYVPQKPHSMSWGSQKRLWDSIENNGNWEHLFTIDSLNIFPTEINNIVLELNRTGRQKLARQFLEGYIRHYTHDAFSSGGMIKLTKILSSPFPISCTSISRQSLFSSNQQHIDRIASKFHYNEIVIKEQTIRHQREMMAVIIICGCLVVCVLLLSFRIVMGRRRRREELLIQSAAELKATVNQTNHKWLGTLTQLCDTYYDAYSRQSTKSKIAKSALTQINEAIDSDDFFPMLEKRLNQEKDDIMNILRQEMPTLREDEYRLLMLNALGFSIPTLALLMREKRDLIYTRRMRLRAKIQDSAAPHADLFLQALS